MEPSNTTQAPGPEAHSRELVRPREGRMVAGVAQGLANRFDIPVLLIRALFVILAFAGGGFVLYATGWFLIRSEDEPRSPAERLFSSEATSG